LKVIKHDDVIQKSFMGVFIFDMVSFILVVEEIILKEI